MTGRMYHSSIYTTEPAFTSQRFNFTSRFYMSKLNSVSVNLGECFTAYRGSWALLRREHGGVNLQLLTFVSDVPRAKRRNTEKHARTHVHTHITWLRKDRFKNPHSSHFVVPLTNLILIKLEQLEVRVYLCPIDTAFWGGLYHPKVTISHDVGMEGRYYC